MWQLCLLVKYNIKALCVCVCVCCWRGRNWYWYIYDTLADTMILKRLSQLFREWRQWIGYWGILSQYLTSIYTVSICLRKELQGKKLTLTYLLGRLIPEYIWYSFFTYFFLPRVPTWNTYLEYLLWVVYIPSRIVMEEILVN